jgi:hypothetical protein
MHQSPTWREAEPAADAFSISRLVHTIVSYLPVIITVFIAVMVAYLVFAVTSYAMAPSETVATLFFRLEFSGAENGKYPNGTKFSPTDIINTPILGKVYAENDLKRFLSFDRFKSRVYILESNPALESLRREYDAKLADPKLTPLDRDRLEREFDTKAQSLAHNDYSINFSQQSRVSTIPTSIIAKVLHDILGEFAEQAMKDRGGLDYKIPVVTRAIFVDSDPARAPNLTIATDMLRAKIRAATATIDALATAPGAEVLRTDKERLSLPEIRGRFEDIVRFRLQPLTMQLLASRIDDPGANAAFFRAQLEYNQLRAEETSRREAVLRNALSAYQNRDSATTPAGLAPDSNAGARADAPSGGTVTPQVTESFIDRIVSMSTRTADLSYRQEVITKIISESMRVVPYQSEVDYYKALLTASGGGSAITRDEALRQLTTAYAAALQTVDQLVEIHQLLSKNLNPRNVMFSVTAPVAQYRERTISLRRLAVYGVLVALLSLPLIIAGCLIHNRVREEDEETAQHEHDLSAARAS